MRKKFLGKVCSETDNASIKFIQFLSRNSRCNYIYTLAKFHHSLRHAWQTGAPTIAMGGYHSQKITTRDRIFGIPREGDKDEEGTL